MFLYVYGVEEIFIETWTILNCLYIKICIYIYTRVDIYGHSDKLKNLWYVLKSQTLNRREREREKKKQNNNQRNWTWCWSCFLVVFSQLEAPNKCDGNKNKCFSSNDDSWSFLRICIVSWSLPQPRTCALLCWKGAIGNVRAIGHIGWLIFWRSLRMAKDMNTKDECVASNIICPNHCTHLKVDGTAPMHCFFVKLKFRSFSEDSRFFFTSKCLS